MYFTSFTAGKYLVRFPTDLISRVEVLRKVEVGEPDYHISNLLECTCSSSACLSSRKNETKTFLSKVDIEVDKIAGEAVGPWCAKKCHICQLCLMCVQFHAHIHLLHITLCTYTCEHLLWRLRSYIFTWALEDASWAISKQLWPDS